MTPDQNTIEETFIEVGNGHTLYVQSWGNPKGMPVIFVHGGPGGYTSDKNKQQFNPKTQHVVFYDQRSCGRSLPYGSLEHNTTAKLIGDLNKIAKHFKMKKFVLCGGSWGACLALAYAIEHPENVKALVLAGVFTGSQAEIDYFEKDIYATYFPDVWEYLLDNTPKAYHPKPISYHFGKVLGKNEAEAKKSAYLYENIERSLLSLDDRFVPEPYEGYDRTNITMEIFYLKNRCFLPDKYILNQSHRLKMPVWIVQGRYDFICPGRTAHELANKLPDVKFYWTVSGHRNERETWNLTKSILDRLEND